MFFGVDLIMVCMLVGHNFVFWNQVIGICYLVLDIWYSILGIWKLAIGVLDSISSFGCAVHIHGKDGKVMQSILVFSSVFGI